MLKRIIQWLAGPTPQQDPPPIRVLPVLAPAVEPPQAPRIAGGPPDIAHLPRTQRLFMEQQILSQRFPAFGWQRDNDGVRIEGPIRTSTGHSYHVRVLVPAAFPFAHPWAFIVSQIKGKGTALTEVSHAMHTLSPDSEGHPQICLYNDRNWDPSLTLQHVLIKAAMWLEAFDQHRRTGRPISDFLASVR